MQTPFLAGVQQALHFPGRGLRLDDRRHAHGQQGLRGGGNVRHKFLVGRVIADIRPMMSHPHGGRHDKLLGGVQRIACQPAVGIALKASALGIRGGVVHAAQAQGHGIHEHVMARIMNDADRMIRRNRVQFGKRRQPAVRKLAVIQAPAANPRAGRAARRRLPHPVKHVPGAGNVGVMKADGAQ